MPVDGPSRSALPEGTVTMLFVDVEGSTRLLHALGERFAPARARMREIVRGAVRSHAGREVDWAGDGAFLVFSAAGDAVAAAAELQRALAREPWPPYEALRLRAGLHTGAPELREDGYVGMDVVVAARACAVAHGAQVVLSRATRDAAEESMPAGSACRLLGRHRLKDVPEPVELFQLVAPGLEDEFPPLRALGASSLPALHHRLVGRGDVLARVEELLGGRETRLVTITGAGGAGKSRLALEVAAEAAVHRPVHLVGLAPVTDADLVPVSIATAVGVRESPGRPLLRSIADALAGTRALLVLDNLEHLPAAVATVAELLDLARDLDVLATSRAPLRLAAEHVVPLPPLSEADAMTLFAELASARGVALREGAEPAVREICRRLDGLPLAIELVAARLVLLSPEAIVRALEDGLTLDMEGPVDLPARQRTLRAAIAWSYGLLTRTQRGLHEALAVFPGGCALDDARTLVRPGPEFLSDLESLVAGSLLRSEPVGDGVRLSMLETVREDALARLEERGELEPLRERHAELFLGLAVAAEGALEGSGQRDWHDRLEWELDNLRAALAWSLRAGRVERVLRALSALERFWRAHGHLTEARLWLTQALDEPGAGAEVRARALWTAAHEAMLQSDYDAAIPVLEESLARFRELNDERHVVFSLCELARARSSLGDLERAWVVADEALSIAEAAGDDRAASAALDTLAMIAGYRGAIVEARDFGERSLLLRRALGDPFLVATSANTLGLAAMRAGDLDGAEQAFGECLARADELGEKVLRAASLCALGEIALARGDPHLGSAHLLEALELYRELGDERDGAECVLALAGVAAAWGRHDLAAQLWGGADALRVRGRAALTPDERRLEEAFGDVVVDALGAAEVERLRTAGGVLDLDALGTIAAQLGAEAPAE